MSMQVWRMLVVVWGVAAAASAEELAISLPAGSAPAQKSPPMTWLLTIDDIQGNYSIPFIQSGRVLGVRIRFADAAVVAADLRLHQDGKPVAQQRVTHREPSAGFADLAPGEYSLEVRALGRDGRELRLASYDRIGVGVVIAALGDSITEGYFGRGYNIPDLQLRADRFPRESVSRDGRNFPQFSPTTARHLPNVNCFESWMTSLNDSLASTWRQPVFIANEGWGGITTAGYLHMMRNDAGWQKRMHRLKPRLWLIHLGVNDERAHAKADEVRANLTAMIDLLIEGYQAQPRGIFLAIPSYDYAEGASAILQTYAAEIKTLVDRRGLGRGPDFYEAYSTDQPQWYGGDPVHPNIKGMVRMAKLWHDAIVAQLPTAP